MGDGVNHTTQKQNRKQLRNNVGKHRARRVGSHAHDASPHPQPSHDRLVVGGGLLLIDPRRSRHNCMVFREILCLNQVVSIFHIVSTERVQQGQLELK